MRILIVTLLMAWASVPALAFDAEKHRLEGGEAALSDGRFELKVTRMQEAPTSPDGRFTLDSGLDPEASRTVSDGRYTLSSDLQSKSALLTCGPQPELVFSDGFEL